MAWITHSPVTPPHKHRCLLKKGTTHVWFTPFQRKNPVCSKLCSSFAPLQRRTSVYVLTTHAVRTKRTTNVRLVRTKWRTEWLRCSPFRPHIASSASKEPSREPFTPAKAERGGNVTQAAVDAGYSKGSSQWLKKTLADEIVERTKDILSVNAIKAANRLVNTIDNPAPERGDDLRLKAAESLLTRVGVKAPEQVNHNVTAVHGVVLLPPKNEVIIDG